MRTVGFSLLLAYLLSGCATVETVQKAGEEYSEGNFVWGTIMLTLSPLMLVPDIFTLGGMLDDQQSAELWTGAVSQYAQYETGRQQQEALQQQQAAVLRQQQYLQQQAIAAAEAARQQEWNEQNQRAWELQRQSQQAAQSSSPSITIKGGVPAQGSGSTATVGSGSVNNLPRVQSSCLTVFDIGDLTAKFKNNCSMPIKVSWCWIPKGASRCAPDRTSDILRPGATSYASGPFSERNSRIPYVYVCDATRGDHPCK